MEKRFDTVIDGEGRPVPNALITVTTYPDGADAVIYPADGGDPHSANVLVADQYGFFEYYAADGRYAWRIETNTEIRTINDILHGGAVLVDGIGFVVSDGENLFTRDITVAGDGLGILNGDGQNGDAILGLTDDVAAIEALSGTGFLQRTGDETWELTELDANITVFALEDSGSQFVAITAGADKAVWESFPGCTIVDIWAGIRDASSDGDVTIDIHLDGTTIMDTDKLDIAEGETQTGEGGATPPELTTTVVPHKSRLSMHYDAAGTGVTGVIVYVAAILDTDNYVVP